MTELTLQPLPGYSAFPGPVVAVIMDGIGLGPQDASDGVHVAYTPTLDHLFQDKLMFRLKAHGKAVGLPSDGDMGNSEVGHNALGAGRVFAQGAKLVNAAIAGGTLFAGRTWREVMERAGKGGTVHFIGLVSDGNVHSHIDQLYALVDRCAAEKVKRVRVHALIDGRDVGEKSALEYIVPLEQRLAAISGCGLDYRIASGGGRMVTTMDRYNANWQVVENGWKAHVLGEGRRFAAASEARCRLLCGRPGDDRPVHGQFRGCRGRGAGRDDQGWRRGDLLQFPRSTGPSRSPGPSRMTFSPSSTASAGPTCSTPG